MVKPGDRVRFLEAGPLYKGGLRTGTVVSVTERLGAFLDRRSKELGLPAEAFRWIFDFPTDSLDSAIPVVALDASPHDPRVPDGFQVIVKDYLMQAI